MKKLKDASIKMKLPVLLGFSSLAIMTAICVLLIFPLRQNALEDSMKIVESTAIIQGSRLAEAINSAAGVPRSWTNTIVEVISTDLIPRQNRREFLMQTMKLMVETDDRLDNIWCMFEPNAIDGMDSLFINRTGSNSTGRFALWISKAGESFAMEMENSDEFFAKTKDAMRERISEPYPYDFNGQIKHIISVCFPIIINDAFVGVAGTDFCTEELHQLIAGLDSVMTGKLVTNQGTVAVYIDKERIGKRAEYGNRAILDRLADGEMFQGVYPFEGEDVFKVYVPVALGERNAPWFFAVDVPLNNLYAQANQIVILLILFCLVGVLLITFSGIFMVRPILNGVTSITEILRQVSVGKIDLQIDKKQNKDEIGEMKSVLRVVVDDLKNMAYFARSIGEGNLNAEYQPLGEDDVLGNSLKEMQHSLQNANREQAARAKEEEQRNWATQGLAKFADILRNDNDNMETLANSIVSNLVKYVNANQGGLFVLNDGETEEERVLEMKACFAYDRNKFADKVIHPGEGLVGTCFLEGELIYITEVPDSYITITSGLGDSNPRAILICPLKLNDEIYGVLELASFREFEPYQIEFVQKISESIASTIGSVKVSIRTSKLLEQTKLQAEEMINQEEELRQNMEEMQATQEDMRRREADLAKALSMNEYQLKKIDLVVKSSALALWDMNLEESGGYFGLDSTVVWSDELRKMLGFVNENDFPNVLQSLVDAMHPEDRENAVDAFKRHVFDKSGQTGYDIECRMIRRNGETIYVHATGDAIRDAAGNALHIAGSIKDITGEKLHQTERRNRTAELAEMVKTNRLQLAKLNLVIKASNIGLWDMEIDNGDPFSQKNTVVWSEEYRKILGYKDENDFPNTMQALVDATHPDDLSATLDAFSKHVLDRTGQTPFDIECRMLKKTGEYAYIHKTGAATRDGLGFAIRVAGSIKDVTGEKMVQEEKNRRTVELQESLKKVRDAQSTSEEKQFEMEQFHDAVVETFNVLVFNAEGFIIDINDNLMQLLGSKDRRDFVGKHDSEFISKEEYDLAWKNVKQGKKWDTVQQVTINGKKTAIRQKYVPICNKSGEVQQVLLLVFLDDKKKKV